MPSEATAAPGSPEDILRRVQIMVAKHLGLSIDKVPPEAGLMDDLGADSLDTVELTMAAEEDFHIELLEVDVERLHTVGDLAQLVHSKLGDGR